MLYSPLSDTHRDEACCIVFITSIVGNLKLIGTNRFRNWFELLFGSLTRDALARAPPTSSRRGQMRRRCDLAASHHCRMRWMHIASSATLFGIRSIFVTSAQSSCLGGSLRRPATFEFLIFTHSSLETLSTIFDTNHLNFCIVDYIEFSCEPWRDRRRDYRANQWWCRPLSRHRLASSREHQFALKSIWI